MAVRILEMRRGNSSWGVFDNLETLPFDTVQAPMTPSGTSQQSSAFHEDTTVITVEADEAVHVYAGVNPTATTSHPKIPAGGTRSFRVTGGHKLAAIAAA